MLRSDLEFGFAISASGVIWPERELRSARPLAAFQEMPGGRGHARMAGIFLRCLLLSDAGSAEH